MFPLDDESLTNFDRIGMVNTLLSGLISNPSIVARNETTGWAPVNCSYQDLVQYALRLQLEIEDQIRMVTK